MRYLSDPCASHDGCREPLRATKLQDTDKGIEHEVSLRNISKFSNLGAEIAEIGCHPLFALKIKSRRYF